MSKINVRSPYHVNYTTSGLESLQLELFIWEGHSVNDKPATSNYTLNAVAIDENVTFEISELISDYVNTTFDGTYTSSAVWADYTLTSTVNGSDTIIPVSNLKQVYDGYGYFSDGVNPQNRNALLVSSPTIYKMKDEVLTLPYNVGADLSISFSVTTSATTVTNSVDSYAYDGSLGLYYIYGSDLFLNGTPNVGDSIELSTDGINFSYSAIIQSVDTVLNRIYLTGLSQLASWVNYRYTTNLSTTDFDSSNFDNTSDKIIQYFDSSNIFKVLPTTDGNTPIDRYVVEIEECRNTPYKLTFVNKFGALEDIWFYGASRKKMNTSKEDYKANILNNGTYSINEHQNKLLTKNGIESMIINSNFYPEAHNETFKQLFLSHKVWITYEGKVLPIHIKSSDLTYKTQLRDKLINYEVEIEFSNDTVNNIR